MLGLVLATATATVLGAEAVIATDAALEPCPSSPNCVSSDSPDDGHWVAPFVLRKQAGDPWRSVSAAVRGLPRTEVVFQDEHRLHAEVRSRMFGFVDDLQLEYRPELNLVAVRSASRKGYWDLGVNRSRVEALRDALRADGIID